MFYSDIQLQILFSTHVHYISFTFSTGEYVHGVYGHDISTTDMGI